MAAGPAGAAATGSATTPATPPPAEVPPAPKIDWHSTPQVDLVTTKQQVKLEREIETRKLRDAWKIARTLGVIFLSVVAFGALIWVLQMIFNRVPSPEKLDAMGREVANELLRRHASAAQPLSYVANSAALVERRGPAGARYEVTVTLGVVESLYGPAEAPGAQAYRDLQLAVLAAQERFAQARLFRRFPELGSPPDLPPLISLLHRAEQRVIFAVPVDAQRRFWSWDLRAQIERARLLTPKLRGEVLARMPVPHLIFGRVESRQSMRRLQQQARDYVLAVQRAIAADRDERLAEEARLAEEERRAEEEAAKEPDPK